MSAHAQRRIDSSARESGAKHSATEGERDCNERWSFEASPEAEWMMFSSGAEPLPVAERCLTSPTDTVRSTRQASTASG